MQPPSIFINYRREDSKWFAVLLKEKIEAAFEHVRVFLDTEDIEPGADWPDTLEQELQQASVVLALIGDKWLFCQDEYGVRRLDGEGDWVRKEIEFALSSGKSLLVILADLKDKKKQPSEAAFKSIPTLKDLPRKQHLEIRSGNFSNDFLPLKNQLAKLLNQIPLDPQSAAKRENILREYPLSRAVLKKMPRRPLAPGADPKWAYCPFVGLNYFTRDTARLYFGRGQDLLELIHIIKNRNTRIIFLHGYSGVGKSSLLSAGLVPRLEEKWLPLYHRRKKELGLAEGLRGLRKEAASANRPALYILDQVEEMFTDISIKEEHSGFIQELSAAVEEEPEGTFLLGFRSEYLSKVEHLCWDISCGKGEKEILPLSWEGIVQAVTGVWKDETLNSSYKLDIEEGLPEKIAGHLSLHQNRDYVAPILQNRLERLWEKAFKGAGKEVKLTKALYEELGDTSEKELLNSRLAKVQFDGNWDEEKAIEVLNAFVVDLPSAGTIAETHLKDFFSGIDTYPEIIEELRKVDLLIQYSGSRSIRLSHDLLAKFVRNRYNDNLANQNTRLRLENFNLNIKKAEEFLRLHNYKEASEALENALSLGVQKERLQEKIMELIFIYNETGKEIKALEWLHKVRDEEVFAALSNLHVRLDALGRSSENFRDNCNSILQELDKESFERLKKRYYPEVVKVEGGAFEMGNEEGGEDEKPPHRVVLSSFLMATAPVSFCQYSLFCAATGKEFPVEDDTWIDNQPVINVSWFDAAEYCNWFSRQEGLDSVYSISETYITPNWGANGYRLPTEAEWEYAARQAGPKLRFGNWRGIQEGYQSAVNLDLLTAPKKNRAIEEEERQKAGAPEGALSNSLYVYDMSDNVWEWCWDWHDKDYYKKSYNAQNPEGPESGSDRVLRGGSWDIHTNQVHYSRRVSSHPNTRNERFGFRLVKNTTFKSILTPSGSVPAKERGSYPEAPFGPTRELPSYELPVATLLDDHSKKQDFGIDRAELEVNKDAIIETLLNYKIEITKIRATIGPSVTLYEIVPAPGVRITRIRNLEEDIALSLAALGVRIIAPIPGKGTIGIEVPNKTKYTVSIREALTDEKYMLAKMGLPVVLGKTISNEVFVADLAKMPHLLIAGAAGQGKSVGINTFLMSLLYKKHPSEVKLILIAQKEQELSYYRNLKNHFLAFLPGQSQPVISEAREAVQVLNSLCVEMDRRYEQLKKASARNIREYNEKFLQRLVAPSDGHRFMAYIILVIDEFSEIIIPAGKDAEMPIGKLAQLGRAVGIHLIITTKHPSPNVITGVIKANFHARIAYKVTSKADSRIILDADGAEQLAGKGDLLLSVGGVMIRLQGVYVDTAEVKRVVDFIAQQPGYSEPYLLPNIKDDEI